MVLQNVAHTNRTYSPLPIPVPQPAVRFSNTTLDICLQTLTNANQQHKPQPIKPEYISLYLHHSSQSIEKYLIGLNEKTTYSLDIPLETWKNILEETLKINNLIPFIEQIATLQSPHPANIYQYIFSYRYYKIVGLILNPLKPPFWDYLNNKK